MEKARVLIVLSNMIGKNDCPYDRLALDLESMKIIHIKISDSNAEMVDDILYRKYPICIAANLEASYRDTWIARSIRLLEKYSAGEIRKILAVKASYPYCFLDGSFHLQYGLGRLHSFSELSWIENRLWMKNAVISGTDIKKTVPVIMGDWKDMIDDHNRKGAERQLQDWSNEVFCVMLRRNVNRDTYCFSNILILKKD